MARNKARWKLTLRELLAERLGVARPGQVADVDLRAGLGLLKREKNTGRKGQQLSNRTLKHEIGQRQVQGGVQACAESRRRTPLTRKHEGKHRPIATKRSPASMPQHQMHDTSALSVRCVPAGVRRACCSWRAPRIYTDT
jgi:hypothetical protein